MCKSGMTEDFMNLQRNRYCGYGSINNSTLGNDSNLKQFE